MRFTNYDKMHDELTKILMECTPPDLWGTWDTYGRGYAAGLHRALYVLECQDKFTDWDDRQKLLQPERSDFDWSIVNAMVNGLLDNGALPDDHEQWPLMRDSRNRLALCRGDNKWGWINNKRKSSSTNFCAVDSNGLAYQWGASSVLGVRPAFQIVTCRKTREEAETCHS